MDTLAVKDYLLNLQQQLCDSIEQIDGKAHFIKDQWQREEGGGGISRALANGQHIEKGGVNFSHIHGKNLPPSASASRPELAGRSFQAMGVSVVIHPNNPHAPTSHANVRFFIAEKEGEMPIFWFGGGYDLTPYYLYEEDAVHWHTLAKAACDPFGENLYAELKKTCDEYFYLKHRGEGRGIGGLFFDDWNDGNFDSSFAFMRSVGDSFGKAYLPILKKRLDIPFNDHQRDYQLHRRGRYVEFNLVFDRGTLFGLQSGGRTESILMSLPPIVKWDYDWQVPENSIEQKLLDVLKNPKRVDMTDQYAVFGNPVAHSKSPEMHLAFARETAQDIHYTKQQVEEGQFEQAVKDFQRKGGKGLNITVPFKLRAFEIADQKTERATKAQAANTLIFQEDGQILADNTDGFGLVQDIATIHQWPIKDKNILILGAGGAVQGIIAPLFKENPTSIKIFNRTYSKALAIAEYFNDNKLEAIETLDNKSFDLIINGTSASLTGHSLNLPASLLHENTCCYDMMYGKDLTPFLQWAKDNNISQLADGLGMLVNQGAEAFRLWRNVMPDAKPVITQLRAGLNQ